jgi:hypothetical protein
MKAKARKRLKAQRTATKRRKKTLKRRKVVARKGHRVKVTVDGKTGFVDLESYLPGLGKVYEQADAATKEKFVRNIQKSIAADKRFEENTRLKRHSSALIQTLKSEDPFAIFRHPEMKMDPQKYREYLEKELWENFVHPEQMDPKERELWELKKQLKMKTELEDKQKRESEEAELRETTKFFRDDLQKNIMSTIDEHSLPKSAYVVGLFAKYMRQAMQHKGPDGKPVRIKPQQVADIVKDDLQKMYKHLFASADGDRLIEVFGEDIAEKINAARLKKLDGGDGVDKKAKITGDAPANRSKKKKGPASFSEWRTRNRPKD